MKNLLIKNLDSFSKGLQFLSKKALSQALQGNINKLIISVHIQKVEKIYDYFILQSICLLDTISSQKPKLRTLKCKYVFGSRAFSYSCKTTLRKRKLKSLINLFDLVTLSEMKRRHVLVSSVVESTSKVPAFSFAIKNTNVFLKLDEFYFKWHYPIVFTFVLKQHANKNLLYLLS